MALGLKVLLQLDISGGSIWITDKTGEYVVASNEGGWGVAGTPNPDLAQSALVWSVVRNDLAGKQKVQPVSFDTFHDNSALNIDETTVEFAYLNDGWYTMTMFRLPVSADGVNKLEGGTLVEGEYYLSTDTNNSGVKQIVSGSPEDVEDYEVMVDDITVVQIKCEEMFYSKLAIKSNDLYKEYRDIRDKKGGDYKDARNKLAEVTDIREDIRGADYAFRSGLTTEGQDIIETAITRYDIV